MNKQIILHLSLIDGIGPVTIKKVLRAHSASCADLYQFSSHDFMHHCGCTRAVAQKLAVGLASTQELDKELALIERHSVQWVTLGDQDYPKLLAEIHAPPPVLYWNGGSFFHETKTIAIIGSRRAHRYAEQVIEQFVPDLVNQGWVIVSGGAIGADSMAHRATVRAQGKTVVVLGSGLLYPYPSSNRGLFDDIVRHGGTLLSSFPLATQARPGNFPARNRIIAGLSRGCVVVQAAEKSGARITAQFALDQGRDVFAVPGPVGDELSAGCHGLIQEGAKLIGGAQDIVAEFSWLASENKPVAHTMDKKIVTRPTPPTSKRKAQPVIQDNSTEGKIVSSCAIPRTTDELALSLGLDVGKVQEVLFELQLAGRIQQNFAGLWERL